MQERVVRQLVPSIVRENTGRVRARLLCARLLCSGMRALCASCVACFWSPCSPVCALPLQQLAHIGSGLILLFHGFPSIIYYFPPISYACIQVLPVGAYLYDTQGLSTSGTGHYSRYMR